MLASTFKRSLGLEVHNGKPFLWNQRKHNEYDWYAVDAKAKTISLADRPPVDLLFKEIDGKKIGVNKEEGQVTIGVYEEGAEEPSKKIPYQLDHRDSGLKVLGGGSNKVFFEEFTKDGSTKLVSFDLQKGEATHKMSFSNPQIYFVGLKYVDDDHILLLTKPDFFSDCAFLNSLSIQNGKWFWKKCLKVFQSAAVRSHINWQLTEKVHRVSVCFAKDGDGSSSHCGLRVYDLMDPSKKKGEITIKVEPIPYYSGKIAMEIPPEDHRALAQKAADVGMTLLEYLKQELNKIAQ